MPYAIVFALFAGYLAAPALLLGGPWWPLLWPAASFLLLAAAYAGAGPGLLGKRPGGGLAWWAYPAAGPVLGLLAAVWHLRRLLSRETAANEVAPGLWLGRRPLAGELPEGVRLVVDLTAEFPAARGVIAGHDYACLPTLDGLAPAAEEVERMLARIAECPGAVYVHCALGHGRSALVAAAVLLRRGVAADVKSAEAHLRRRRPGVRLNRAQRLLLGQMFAAAPDFESGE